MPRAPSVGVVVANYNNAAFVERAIHSVAQQSFRNIEVVVIDDASTDGSQAVIRLCLTELNDPRFCFLPSDRNEGQAGALLRGLGELERGSPFVCFLDSDDVWYPEFVARHLEVQLNSDFPVAVTFCDSHLIDGDDQLLAGTAWWFDSGEPGHWEDRDIESIHIPRVESDGSATYPVRPRLGFRPRWSPHGAASTMAGMMFRRSFVDLVLVPPAHELRLWVDFYLSTFASLLTGVIAIHQSLYAYRIHGDNLHSNARVLGGPYNPSIREWAPIRREGLALIRNVMSRNESAILSAFGHDRYREAQAMLAADLSPAAHRPDRRNGWYRNLLPRRARPDA